MDDLHCPRCGSDNLYQPKTAEYKCLVCNTHFRLIVDDSEFVDVVLINTGKKRIEVIKVLRQFSYDEPTMKEINLSQAVRLLDTVPCVVAPRLPMEVGKRLMLLLAKEGALAELHYS